MKQHRFGFGSALDFGITLIDTAEAYGGGQARQYRRNTLWVWTTVCSSSPFGVRQAAP